MSNRPNACLWYFLPISTIALSLSVLAQGVTSGISSVSVSQTMTSLLHDEDTDGDKRITIEDHHITGTSRGDKVFWVEAGDGQRLQVAGTSYLSNLLQELKLAEDEGLKRVVLNPDRIFEPPANRISRMISEVFWDGLTRSIDEEGLAKILTDPKMRLGGPQYLYVPASDKTAVEYYRNVAAKNPAWNLNVEEIPNDVSSRFVKSLNGKHGLLSLALSTNHGVTKGVPFVVPGGRFNEMYGWDSYFIVLGLLHDGKNKLAASMVDNSVYEIRHYGAILNANRSYYLTRSQPPFLTSMIRAVYSTMPKGSESSSWLRRSIEAAMIEYESVWMGSDRLTKTGLSRYHDSGSGPAPEVAEYGPLFAEFAGKHGMRPEEFEERYRKGEIKDEELDEYFMHDRAMRESGHDTSYRLVNRCANLVTVDLNSLLYKIETDIAGVLNESFGGKFVREDGSVTRSSDWQKRAEDRKEKVNRLLWDERRGMYFDYNFVKGENTGYIAATTLYPLWAGLASQDQARLVVKNALPLLGMPGGIAGSSEESRGPLARNHRERQWDFPYGWSPHQMLAWKGLQEYGYDAVARELAYRWLFTITINAAQYNGTVPEKFDVVGRTHKVFAEYGNVGTTFSYITREGFGWTNASYQLGLEVLTPQLRERLNRLVPPDWLPEF